jgi:hypothetical protein
MFMRKSIAAVVGLMAIVGPGGAQGRFEIKTLSSRADLVSGGDALIEVTAAPTAQLAQLALKLNGRDVTSRLSNGPRPGTFRALIDGLTVGPNMLQAEIKNTSATASLAVTNYPITGPILSGPHLTPYECNTSESGLGEPLDTNCSAARKIWYLYRTTEGAFKQLTDPAGPRPADLAQTKTSDGKTVPYIVRVDSGTINRAIYQLAILDDPKPATIDPAAWQPTDGWNRKLMVTFGGGSGTQYVQGSIGQPGAAQGPIGQGVLSHTALSRGFAHLISSELVNGRRGNGVLQGETLMMLKEYFIERYGVPKWTVGNGGSGGAIQQLVITQMYPGLLDGLMPSLSFPDSALHTIDSILLSSLWPKLDATVWTQEKKTAVEGFTPGTATAWNRAYGRLGVPSNAQGCALADKSLVYDAAKNPKGARCTTQDIRVNIYGRDPKTGFARRPTDNIGVQYGLGALNSRAITVDEFLELNEKIGGTDIEGNVVTERTEGDRIALKAAYDSGLVASYSKALGNVPILLYRTYTDSRGDIHDRQRDFVIRARLQKVNGRVDNTAIWIYQGARAGLEPVDVMNQWLDAIVADATPVSIDKVVKHKPADAVDTCWDESGKKIVEPARFDGEGACNTLFPVHSEPRLVAGAPLTNDILKCELKPVNFAEYQATFSDAQKARMKKVFATGVCDFSKPGVEQRPIQGTYRKY